MFCYMLDISHEKPIVFISLYLHLFNRISDVKYQIMKFNSNLNIDFVKWSHAKMERDINKGDGQFAEEDMPK